MQGAFEEPLEGWGGAGVLEIIEDDDGNTDRAVYCLDTLQKKSNSTK